MNVTVTVPRSGIGPPADEVNPVLQVADPPPVCGLPANVTSVTEVAAAIVIPVAGEEAGVSCVVATEKFPAGYAAAAGLITPKMRTDRAESAATEQPPPPPRVSVMVVATVAAEAIVHPPNPVTGTAVGITGMPVKAGSNATVIVSPEVRTPVAPLLKPIV